MSLFAEHPRVMQALISAAILAGSYLAARAVSYLLARVLLAAAARTTTTLDDRLVRALERSLSYALVLVGAYVAAHRLPLHERWTSRLDNLLFVLGVLLASLALVRVWTILMGWYTIDPRRAAPDTLAREFGPLFAKLGVVFIAVLAAITTLQHFGVSVASLVVSLGVGSLALGLAAQDTLSNMFAGFTLMLDRPFRVGDRIQLSTGEVGDVEMIGIRATLIRTLDETMLVVPNNLLVRDRLVNRSQPTRRIATHVEVGVAYGSDLGLVRRLLREAALACPAVDREREPVVLVTRFGDFSVTVLLVFWVRDYLEQGQARSDVHEEIDRRLRAAGIEMPSLVRAAVPEAGARARRSPQEV